MYIKLGMILRSLLFSHRIQTLVFWLKVLHLTHPTSPTCCTGGLFITCHLTFWKWEQAVNRNWTTSMWKNDAEGVPTALKCDAKGSWPSVYIIFYFQMHLFICIFCSEFWKLKLPSKTLFPCRIYCLYTYTEEQIYILVILPLEGKGFLPS